MAAVPSTEFEYVVKRQEKARICFGSGLERKTLESDVNGLFSKHARRNMKENMLSIMPGMYEVSQLASAMDSVTRRPTSKLGTVMGGRTAPRKDMCLPSVAPAPGTYEIASAFAKPACESAAPFNVSSKRTPPPTSNYPGVGLYRLSAIKCRSVPFAHSFGGRKCVIPAVKLKCGPFNFDTCERCQEAPEGDYWFLDLKEVKKPETKKEEKGEMKKEGIFLCRPCYNVEKLENKIFSKGQIRAFKKIRSCSTIHFHGGCEGKVYLVPPNEIRRERVREAYLSQFFK